MHVRRALALSATVATVTAGLVAPGFAAGAVAAAPAPAGAPSDVREIDHGKDMRLPDVVPSAQSRTTAPKASASTPPVGTVRQWIANDDLNGSYFKSYELKAVGDKIEVWVATDLSFPAGDCRNSTPNTTTVTSAQAKYLADQFDNNMYPKEAKAFSVAPDRDGTKADPRFADYPSTGDGDKTVTLVDNVRDDNYYEFPANPTYIAGFFSSAYNEAFDRNMMTIDAFDWLHRTGANPPDATTDDLCTSRPSRPFLYEGTFAHEYQHLLQYYQDPNEVNFINEGLSDFAISLTGYGRPEKTVQQRGVENHIACFQGFGPYKTQYNTARDCGGPQNSLTLWGDEGSGSEILADYGNAWSFQLFLFDRYGIDFMSALHRDGGAQGLTGVQDQLDHFAPGTKVFDVVHDFQTMNLVDRYVGGAAGGTVMGRPVGAVTSKSLNATLNLNNQTSYALPGAAPNGADFVALRGGGTTLTGDQLKSVSFSGAEVLPAIPLKWTTVTNAPGRTGPVLWSGNESNLDSTAVTEVTVPTGNPTLTYVEKHLAEATYDYAYTVVSTDGGKTYTPLSNANTVAGPLGPALNGDATAFATQTFDLSAYAGKKVLVGFRYVSDGGVNDGGWYIDDIKVGGALVSDGSLGAFKSPTQIRPVPVHLWHVRLIGLDAKGHRSTLAMFDNNNAFTVSADQLARFKGYPEVVAQVGFDDPTEQIQQFAPYTLKVNGVVQPGG